MHNTNKHNYLSMHLVAQHKLFNEHLVSTSGNPALVMRRKKHTEKEVHAHLISVVSVRLREGYTIREIGLTKGELQTSSTASTPFRCQRSLVPNLPRWDPAGGEAGAAVETQHAHRILGSRLLASGLHQEEHQGGGDHGGELRHLA